MGHEGEEEIKISTHVLDLDNWMNTRIGTSSRYTEEKKSCGEEGMMTYSVWDALDWIQIRGSPVTLRIEAKPPVSQFEPFNTTQRTIQMEISRGALDKWAWN